MSIRTLQEDPRVWSWFDADQFDGVDTFLDKGPRGNNWRQTNSGVMPTETTNWRSRGVKARNFNGTSHYIDAPFEAPYGVLSVMALLDLDATVSTGDNITRTILSNYTGNSSGNMFTLQQVNRGFQMTVQGQATAGRTSPASAVSTPLLVTWTLDPVANLFYVDVNNGTPVILTPSSGERPTPYRRYIQLGRFAGEGVAASAFWKGHLQQVIVFNVGLRDARHATLHTDAKATLAAVGGITLL